MSTLHDPTTVVYDTINVIFLLEATDLFILAGFPLFHLHMVQMPQTWCLINATFPPPTHIIHNNDYRCIYTTVFSHSSNITSLLTNYIVFYLEYCQSNCYTFKHTKNDVI